jgi:hypothetical protein
MNYLLLLSVGLGVVWGGIRLKDEADRLTVAITGAILLVWGLTLTPTHFQVLAGVLAVFAIFSICLRCWG